MVLRGSDLPGEQRRDRGRSRRPPLTNHADRASKPLASLSEWLRCPKCLTDLQPTGALALGCESGHRYDVNRRGYISLLQAGGSKVIGDSPAMLDARASFLDAGWYAPILEALEELHAPIGDERIIDAGSGTGYYLHGLSDSTEDPRALAMDLSPAAVARVIRSGRGFDGLVADVWQPLPIRTAAAETLLNVFAPRNVHEFARILVPGGELLVVVPRAEHLRELRDAGLALAVPAGKAEQLSTTFHPFFSASATKSVSFRMPLDDAAVELVLGMGPSSHHRAAAASTRFDEVTASVDVLRFIRH